MVFKGLTLSDYPTVKRCRSNQPESSLINGFPIASIKTKVIESRRKANMGAIGGYDDEMESWDNFNLEENTLSINQANLSGSVDDTVEAMDRYFEVFEGRSRRHRTSYLKKQVGIPSMLVERK